MVADTERPGLLVRAGMVALVALAEAQQIEGLMVLVALRHQVKAMRVEMPQTMETTRVAVAEVLAVLVVLNLGLNKVAMAAAHLSIPMQLAPTKVIQVVAVAGLVTVVD